MDSAGLRMAEVVKRVHKQYHQRGTYATSFSELARSNSTSCQQTGTPAPQGVAKEENGFTNEIIGLWKKEGN